MVNFFFSFFFHLQHTKEHQTDTRNAVALPCTRNANHSDTDTFYSFTRKFVKQMSAGLQQHELAFTCSCSASSEIM